MKKAYLKLFSIMLGISLILASVVFIISNNFKAEKQKVIDEERAIIDEIGDFYESFKTKLDQFSEKHDEFIGTVDDKTAYYAIIPGNYDKLISYTKEYETFLTELDDFDSYLYENCKGKFYSKKSINNDCVTYMRNMEKVVNTFIEDIKYLNHRIDEYNKWTVEENKSVLVTTKYKTFDEYKSEKYNKYVDLDGDGITLGVNAD